MQLWWCGDWIFVFINEDPVLALPKLHWLHWYWYQSSTNINTEVQGLVLGYKEYHFEIGVHPIC